MNEKDELNTWEKVIVDFFENKKRAEEEKYLKEAIKVIDEKYKKEQYFNMQDMQDFFDTKKNKKDKNQTSLEFQQQKLQTIMAFEVQPSSLSLENISTEYTKKCEEINTKFLPVNWFNANAQKASSVSFATHVIKLTHSKIDTASFYDEVDTQKDSYLTTSSLKNKAIDGAVAGNQFAPIFQFLELELKAKKLASEFQDINNEILKVFTNDEKILKAWNEGFNKSLTGKFLSSHFLAKQIYFPVNNNDQHKYHLLTSVKSSSMAHAIYNNVFNDNEKQARELKKKDKYSKVTVNSFLKKAKISVTASNHSNASQLNGKRGGKLFLFSTQHPTWKSQLKPPLHKKSMFDTYYLSPESKTTLEYLSAFLKRFKDIGLSIKDPKRKEHLDRWVNDLIDDWLFYVGTMQNFPAGWSDESKLKSEHRFLLDPYKKNKDFQAQRQTLDWQKVIYTDFSQWLNKQLKKRDKAFTPQTEHTAMWKKLVKPTLREYADNITFDALQKEGGL